MLGSIWLLTLIVVSVPDGKLSVDAEVHFANDPKFNTAEMCDLAGKTLADTIQQNLGTKGAVFYKCESASIDSMLKGVGKTAPKVEGDAL